MNENPLFYLITGIASLIIGAILGKLYSKLKFDKEITLWNERYKQSVNQLENLKIEQQKQVNNFKQFIQTENQKATQSITELKEEREQIRTTKDNLAVLVTRQKEQLFNMQQRLEQNKQEVEKLQEKFSTEFENLANRILEEKSEKFTEQNKKNLSQILTPLQEKIQHFEQKIENTNKENIERHAALGAHLKSLHEQNIKISTEANNLTKALKGDSKTQGNWGELILERVLEKSGLEKGREYELEKSFTINDGNKKRLRPDVIIHLPDNKKMIVDSKVSLTAYEKMVNADDELDRKQFLKEHITSLNRHVVQLSDKKYEDLYQIESPDFVLLFIPIEPAFAVAINHDNQLYNKAFEKNIVIVTPSTLLATLRTIDSMWNNEKQQRNALEIAVQAGKLYDKFYGLISDLDKVSIKMNQAKELHQKAINKLSTGSGNLIGSLEKIKKLGIKTKKSLPDIKLHKD